MRVGRNPQAWLIGFGLIILIISCLMYFETNQTYAVGIGSSEDEFEHWAEINGLKKCSVDGFAVSSGVGKEPGTLRGFCPIESKESGGLIVIEVANSKIVALAVVDGSRSTSRLRDWTWSYPQNLKKSPFR